METSWAILTFALVAGIGIVSPGATLLAISRAAASRPRGEVWAVALGVLLGTAVWASVALAVVGLLYTLEPELHLLVRLAGALGLVWLGFELLRYASRPLGRGQELPQTRSWRSAWARGLSTSLSNPKAALYFACVLASAAPQHASWPLLATIVAAVMLVAALWDLAALQALAHAPSAERLRRLKRRVESGFGLLLLAFALRQLVTL